MTAWADTAARCTGVEVRSTTGTTEEGHTFPVLAMRFVQPDDTDGPTVLLAGSDNGLIDVGKTIQREIGRAVKRAQKANQARRRLAASRVSGP